MFLLQNFLAKDSSSQETVFNEEDRRPIIQNVLIRLTQAGYQRSRQRRLPHAINSFEQPVTIESEKDAIAGLDAAWRRAPCQTANAVGKLRIVKLLDCKTTAVLRGTAARRSEGNARGGGIVIARLARSGGLTSIRTTRT